MSDLIKRLNDAAEFLDARTADNMQHNQIHAIHCRTVMEATDRIKELEFKLGECEGVVGYFEQEKAAHIKAVQAAIKKYSETGFHPSILQSVLDLLENERDEL